ncbi:hypothetical protein [Azospirillum griseum]|uniref:hypothetical protein n=1 Tax=Azospirillum griseum TaxID=2496639 RepID=UPI001315287C|nr:hypothetical protein [Azospirillum griseum]
MATHPQPTDRQATDRQATDGQATGGSDSFLGSATFRDEQEVIRQGRAPADADAPLVGLALSGGGIRSASFSIGVIKALHRRGRLGAFDYLSTVSGGGYAGSALTWLIGLGKLDQLGGYLARLRSHGHYLDPGRRLTITALAAVVLRTVLVNLLVYGGLLTVGLFALERVMDRLPGGKGLTGALWGALAIAVFFAIAAFVYALATGITADTVAKRRYHWRLGWQRWGGAALGGAAGLVVLGLLPHLRAAVDVMLADYISEDFAGAGLGGLSVALSGLASLIAKASESSKSGEAANAPPSPLIALLAPVAAALAVLGVLLVAYDVSLKLSFGGAVLLLLVAGGVGAVADLNMMSLHRMYRDRLMEAFLPNKDAIAAQEWTAATEANGAMLTRFVQRPFHLLNTNVILIDSPNTQVRGRGGDNYVLTPIHSGSSTTGWHPTSAIMGRNGRDGLTLATAVAISGAAVNAHVGPGAQPSILRNGAVSFLLSLFGLQLGYWVSNPDKPVRNGNYLVPGFRALTGGGFHRSAWFHMLSDGGHFDNTGVYELIRRRVRTIVAVDAAADPDYKFSDLSAMIEKVRADFGAEIRFPGGSRGTLAELRPARPCVDFPNLSVAERGWIEGTVTYADGGEGRIFFLKLTLIDGLPTDVYGYATANPPFPNQSTADQFFDEFQLESYVTLGDAIADSLPL